jgi:hypothetical protein
MKHSKLLLAISACLLAIAGIAASRVSFRSIRACYFTGGGRIGHVVIVSKAPCTITTTDVKCVYQTVNHTDFPLYTYPTCVKPLYYNAE